MAHVWRGVLREYADRLGVTDASTVVTRFLTVNGGSGCSSKRVSDQSSTAREATIWRRSARCINRALRLTASPTAVNT